MSNGSPGLYNTDQTLWENYKASRNTMPNGGAPLSLNNGMVGNGHEILARFASDAEATMTLHAAGFRRDENGNWK
jgi:hypothetical protein